MTSPALAIIQEFVRSADPRQRSNAAVALASMGDLTALTLLVEIATGDADSTVRQRATQEIRNLEPEQIGVIKELLLNELITKKQSTRHHALAANLAAAGVADFRELPFFKSIRWAWRAMRPDFSSAQNKEFWQAFATLTVGVLCGWLLVSLVCAFLGVPVFRGMGGTIVLYIYSLMSLLLAGVLGWVGPRWQAQARPSYAGVLDLIAIAIALLLTCALPIIVVFTLVGPERDEREALLSFCKFILYCGFSILVARLFSLTVLCATSFPRMLAQLRAACAVFIGIAFLIGFAFTWEGGIDDYLYGSMFALTLPILFGMGVLFAYRDRKYSYKRFVFGRIGAVASTILLAVAVGSFLFSLFRSKPALIPVRLNTSVSPTATITIPDNGQAEINVAEDNTFIRAEASGDYELSLYANGKFVARDTFSPSVKYIGKKGEDVAVRVAPASGGPPTLLSRIGRSLQHKQSGSVEVHLTFSQLPQSQ